MNDVRNDFPFLKRKINGKGIIYLDSAATSQKPKVVIDALVDFYNNHCANIHRGVHKLSQEASLMYEEAREKVAKFLGASSKEEIIFTRNTTEAINIVSHGLNLKKGDEILVSEMEHHSNIVPWQALQKAIGIKLKFIPVDKEGNLDLTFVDKNLSEKTKLISITHVSNFLGVINPVEEIGKIAKEKGIKFMIDGAQSAPHMSIDVKKLKCDFFACSSHKMCGPTGIGVLYGKKEALQEISPLINGGDMISSVSYYDYSLNKLPWKFEGGTSNIADGYAFGIALDYLSKLGMDTIQKHDQKLVKYTLGEIQKIKNVEIYGPMDANKRCGLIAFNLKNFNPHDVAAIMDEKENIMIRSGFHCVEPMHKKLGLNGSARVSFYLYNTFEEIDKFLEVLKYISK